jgi:hypothetical protein
MIRWPKFLARFTPLAYRVYPCGEPCQTPDWFSSPSVLSPSCCSSQVCSGTDMETIRQADLDEVLFDQLNYLLDLHGACSIPCPECARLTEVRRALLRPFITNCAPTPLAKGVTA